MPLPALLSAVGHAVDTGINVVQRAKERSRQEQIDAYNRQAQARAFTAQHIQNSPSYQYQRMKDAGINPLAQGISPDMQSISNPSPLSSPPIPPTESSLGQGLQESISAEQQQQQLDLTAKQIELEKDKLDLEKNKVEFQQNKEKAEVYRDLYAKDVISLDQANEGTQPFGYTIEGKGKDARLVEADIAVKEAEERKLNQDTTKSAAETQGINIDNQIKEFEAKWRDRKLRLECKRQAAEILHLAASTENIKIDTEIGKEAKKVAEIRSQLYEYFGTEDVPADLKMEVVSKVKFCDGFVQGRLLSKSAKQYAQFLEDMRDLEQGNANAQVWARWTSTAATVFDIGSSMIPQAKAKPRRAVGFQPGSYGF